MTTNPYTTKFLTSAVYTFNGGGYSHSYGVLQYSSTQTTKYNSFQ